MGEPSGIGPEVAMAAFHALGGGIGEHPLKLVGDARVFRHYGVLPDAANLPAAPARFFEPGKLDTGNAPSVLAALEEAVRHAQSGAAAAVVTAPIHKAALMSAGFSYPGHTEYLAHLTGARRAVMMLVGASLRVVPLTIHIPYKDVPPRVTRNAIIETARIVLAGLAKDFGIAHPRLAIAGLNPHAGESGELGQEEIYEIVPAIDMLRGEGHAVFGPMPPDTMFHAEARAHYDAALCMYHDQALIPLKTLAFWEGVNVTLGLSIVRTSPDHGTALDIAGQAKADPRSMIAAIKLAAGIADARRH